MKSLVFGLALLFVASSSCFAQTQTDADDHRLDANIARFSAMLGHDDAQSAIFQAVIVGATAETQLGNYESVHGPQPALRALLEQGGTQNSDALTALEAGEQWIAFGDGEFNSAESAYQESDWFNACVLWALAESYYGFGDLCFPGSKALAIQAKNTFQSVIDGIPQG